MTPDGFPKVDVKYRKSMDDFYAWERHRMQQDERTIAILALRRRRGFKIPNWVVALAVLALIAALVWVFRQVIL